MPGGEHDGDETTKEASLDVPAICSYPPTQWSIEIVYG